MKQNARLKPLSLYPLKFDDAVTALLKTKPMPNGQKPKPSQSKGRKKSSNK